jgi:hypothetical protein
MAIRQGLLQNDGGTGVAWTSYTTTDRCVIDLVFAHVGTGQAALVFGADGKDVSLKLPFRSDEPSQRQYNRLIGARCKKGLYGVSPGRWHRATVAVDEYSVRVDLDGRKILSVRDYNVGPGRIGLTVWGKKDRFLVRRLRVLAAPKGKTMAQLLADRKVMALEGWPPKPGEQALKTATTKSAPDR